MSEKLKIEIEVDSKTGEARIKVLGQEMADAGKKGKAGFTSAAAGAESLTSKLGPAGSMLLKLGGAIGGLMILRKGFNELNSAVSECITEANAAEAAESDLQATLRATGGAAGYNLEQLKKMASGMQAATTVGDDLIIGGMSILATFKQVRGEGFERASQAALDMSQIMKQDLKSSMVQIGKAVNDPIEGISALTRVGVTFSEQQKEQIKTLQESGDMVGAQNIILKELETQFGGAAKAARETFGGAVKASQNALGDMKEEIGFVITKNQFFVSLIHMAEKQFMAWGEQIKNNREYLMSLAKEGVLKVVDGLMIALETMRFFHNGWLGIKLVGSAAVAAIAIGIETLVKGLRVMMFGWDALFDALVKLRVMKVNPFDSIVKGLEQFSASSMDVTKSVWSDIEKTNAAYDSAKKAIGDWRSAIEKIPVTQAKAAESVIKSVKTTADEVVESQKDMAEAEKERIAAVVRDLKLEEKARIEAGKKALNILIDRKRAEDDAAKDAERLRREAAADEKKLAADRAAAYRTMYGDLKGKAGDYYDYQDRLLKNERDDYERLIGDKTLADKWYEVQKKKLNQEQLLSSESLFAGIRVGYQRMLDDQKTWAQAGLGIFDSFTKSAESMMSDNFFAVFTGNMDQVRLDWDSMWQSMARSAADHMAKIATETAIDTAIKGMDWLGTALGWWAAGAWEIKKDQLAVLHKGEMVLDPERSARVRSLAGSDPSLGESMPPGGGGYSKGTAGAYVEHAVLSAMLGSAKGFAVNKGIGWAITGKLAMSAIPGGVLASLVNAAYRGVVAYNQAKAMLDAIYGRDVSSNMGWSLRTEADYYGRGLPGDDPMASYGFGRGGVGDDPSAPSGGDFGGGYSGPAGESSSGFWHRGGRFRLRSDEGFFIGARGEEVVTARNLARLEKVIASRSGPSPSPEIRIETKGGGDLVAEIRELRAELKAANYAIAKNTGIAARILDRWDGDGLPAERTI